jgi:hypothetical protein
MARAYPLKLPAMHAASARVQSISATKRIMLSDPESATQRFTPITIASGRQDCRQDWLSGLCEASTFTFSSL